MAGDKKGGFAQVEVNVMAGRNLPQERNLVWNDECNLSPLARRRKDKGWQIKMSWAILRRKWPAVE